MGFHEPTIKTPEIGWVFRALVVLAAFAAAASIPIAIAFYLESHAFAAAALFVAGLMVGLP